MDNFKAIVVNEDNGQVSYSLEIVNLDSLSYGEILIKVSYSSINFKDMLAVQKKWWCYKRLPYDSRN